MYYFKVKAVRNSVEFNSAWFGPVASRDIAEKIGKKMYGQAADIITQTKKVWEGQKTLKKK